MTTTLTRRYGLIGAGAMGQVYLRALAEVDGAELAAVAEPNSDPLTWTFQTLKSSRYNPTIYSDWTEMLTASGLDAVIIATPSDMHFEIASELLKTPINLLVEAPVCITQKDAGVLAKLGRQHGNHVIAGLAFRHDPLIVRLLERVRAGEVGTPCAMSVRLHRARPCASIDNWVLFNQRSGGALLDVGCHAYDVMRQVFGADPVRVYASGGVNMKTAEHDESGNAPDRIDNAFVTLDFAGGGRGHLDFCEFPYEAQSIVQVCVTGDSGQLTVELPVDDPFGTAVERLRQFQRQIVSDEPVGASLSDGLKAVAIGLAAQQSASSGKAVSI